MCCLWFGFEVSCLVWVFWCGRLDFEFSLLGCLFDAMFACVSTGILWLTCECVRFARMILFVFYCVVAAGLRSCLI